MLKKKYYLMARVVPILIVIIILKLVARHLDWEFISLNPLLTSLLAATTFLIGFLITGVISDYKESEKIPGDIANSIEVIFDEARMIFLSSGSGESKLLMNHMLEFIDKLKDWFYKRESTKGIFQKLNQLNGFFILLPENIPVNNVIRMKQEQSNIRKLITRIHTIRETKFVQPAYTVVEILVVSVIIEMIFVKMNPLYESLIFLSLISFIVMYMLFLLYIIDNPFEYKSKMGESTKISLKPIIDLKTRLNEQLDPKD